jgi:hypothetical protein
VSLATHRSSHRRVITFLVCGVLELVPAWATAQQEPATNEVPEPTGEPAAEPADASPAPGDADPAQSAPAEVTGSATGLVRVKTAAGFHPWLRPGQIDFDCGVNLDASEGSEHSVSIAPDIGVGVTDRLAVHFMHSAFARTGFWDVQESGVCVTSECRNRYSSAALELRYGLYQHPRLLVGGLGGVHVSDFDPATVAVRAGIKTRSMFGPLGIHFVPSVLVGVAERTAGNREFILLPLGFMFQINPDLHLGFQTGIRGEARDMADTYSIPLSVGGQTSVGKNATFAASVSLVRIAGYSGPERTDLRAVNVFLGYRL